jgi:hypothetical protein
MPQRIIVPVLILLALGTAATAQQPRGRRGDFGRAFGEGVVFLVGMHEVQRELQLSEEQRELLDDLRADLRTQVRVAFRGGSNSRRNGTTDSGEDVRNRIRDINQRGEELVMLVLEPDQAERLKQLRLQQEGTRAFDRPEVAKALRLTKDQLDQMREIRSIAPNEDANGRVQQRRARRQQIEKDVLAMLSDEQKQSWERMQGAKFSCPSRFARNNSGRRRPGGEESRRERD